MVEGIEVCVGSRAFASGQDLDHSLQGDHTTATAWIAFNRRVAGCYSVKQEYRSGLTDVIASLAGRFRLGLLSGDHHGDRRLLEGMFPQGSILQFDQSPLAKESFVGRIQAEGASVLMIGDGLNDARALLQSNVGVAITDDIKAFSPACDAILEGSRLEILPKFLSLSRASVWIIVGAFALSLLYNILVVGIAVRGDLSPLLAAILMPTSSISVAALTILGIHLAARKSGLI